MYHCRISLGDIMMSYTVVMREKSIGFFYTLNLVEEKNRWNFDPLLMYENGSKEIISYFYKSFPDSYWSPSLKGYDRYYNHTHTHIKKELNISEFILKLVNNV